VSSLGGEALIAVSAIFYSLHVVRLSRLAPGLKPLNLARAKEFARFLYAGVTLLAAVFFSPAQAAALSAFVDSAVASPVATAGGAAAIVLWTGVVTTAFPTWAQSFGQRSLPASTASIVYTTQPLWCAPRTCCPRCRPGAPARETPLEICPSRSLPSVPTYPTSLRPPRPCFLALLPSCPFNTVPSCPFSPVPSCTLHSCPHALSVVCKADPRNLCRHVRSHRFIKSVAFSATPQDKDRELTSDPQHLYRRMRSLRFSKI
jgi:hypothetical protein